MVANPYNTSGAAGFYNSYTDGVMQGMADADAASSNYLAMGQVDPNSSTVMFGGMPITQSIYQGVLSANKSVLDLATNVGNISGFTVFDQGHSGIITPGAGDVPLFYPGMDIGFYRLGSRARIAVRANPSLMSLAGQVTSTSVAWDFVNSELIPTAAGTAQTSTAVTWANGLATITVPSTAGYESGMTVVLSGYTPSGYNGTYSIESVSGNTFTVPLATNPGNVTTQGSVNTPAGVGVLPVQVLGVFNQSQVVLTDAVTGATSWKNGCAAIILV